MQMEQEAGSLFQCYGESTSFEANLQIITKLNNKFCQVFNILPI